MCKIAVGVVGCSERSRHVATVNVGGWDGERRSVEREVLVLSPRWRDCHLSAAVREGSVGGWQFLVVGHKLVLGRW